MKANIAGMRIWKVYFHIQDVSFNQPVLMV